MTLYNVDLYIYDLSQGLAKTLGSLIFRKPVAGVWHTGVVVYGTEYFFGTQGIQFIQPGGTILGHTYRIHNMGKTEVPKELFEEYLRDLADDKFRYDKYHLLDHNCNTFSNEICLFLLNKHIPDYITNLPQEFKQSPLGNFIKPLLDEIYSNRFIPSPSSLNAIRSISPLNSKQTTSTISSTSTTARHARSASGKRADDGSSSSSGAVRNFGSVTSDADVRGLVGLGIGVGRRDNDEIRKRADEKDEDSARGSLPQKRLVEEAMASNFDTASVSNDSILASNSSIDSGTSLIAASDISKGNASEVTGRAATAAKKSDESEVDDDDDDDDDDNVNNANKDKKKDANNGKFAAAAAATTVSAATAADKMNDDKTKKVAATSDGKKVTSSCKGKKMNSTKSVNKKATPQSSKNDEQMKSPPSSYGSNSGGGGSSSSSGAGGGSSDLAHILAEFFRESENLKEVLKTFKTVEYEVDKKQLTKCVDDIRTPMNRQQLDDILKCLNGFADISMEHIEFLSQIIMDGAKQQHRSMQQQQQQQPLNALLLLQALTLNKNVADVILKTEDNAFSRLVKEISDLDDEVNGSSANFEIIFSMVKCLCNLTSHAKISKSLYQPNYNDDDDDASKEKPATTENGFAKNKHRYTKFISDCVNSIGRLDDDGMSKCFSATIDCICNVFLACSEQVDMQVRTEWGINIIYHMCKDHNKNMEKASDKQWFVLFKCLEGNRRMIAIARDMMMTSTKKAQQQQQQKQTTTTTTTKNKDDKTINNQAAMVVGLENKKHLDNDNHCFFKNYTRQYIEQFYA